MRPSIILLLGLGAMTLGAFSGVLDCDFVAYDDPSYVCRNPMVDQGLGRAAFLWAFTASHGGNWHPLTSLSHLLDCSLFGLRASAHHAVNLGWHTLNVVLVFVVWTRLAGGRGLARWRSALVAGLFAWHPLHVESVAWISERKDVLCTAFWLATLLAYLHYAEQPSWRRYLPVALGTALALLAKPMAVTLPGTLLLLDFWPSRRWRARSWAALLWEKTPLFLLAFGIGVATVFAQHSVDATGFGTQWGLGERLGNAVVAYARYLGKMLCPGTLAPFYPHPGAWPWWAVLGAVALLGAGCWLAWRERIRRPWLAWGWGWYLGTLLPVLGIVQVGGQSIADRYTYVPLMGIFTVIAWGAAEFAERRPAWRGTIAALSVLALGACFVRTTRQVPIWRDGIRLAEQIRAAAGEHVITYREMGAALAFAERPDAEVRAQYRRGLELQPDYPFFLNELGLSEARAGRFPEAVSFMEKVCATVPNKATAWTNLASVHLTAGNLDAAAKALRKAVNLEPNDAEARRLTARLYVAQNRMSDAREELEKAVRLDGWNWLIHNELGVVYIGLGRYADGIAELEHALWINPQDQAVQGNLEAARTRAH
jgi:Flp pilus assembly protein TadD